MRHLVCIFIAAVLALLPMHASAAVWDRERGIECTQNRPNCRLLQMAMTGSFETFDPQDALLGRVYASVYPQLCAVVEDDIAHFIQEFGEDESVVRDCLYQAMRNCLWANILTEKIPGGRMNAAERVLLLFIDPSSQEDAEVQMEKIRAALTGEALSALAAGVGAPEDFVRWLIITD